MIKHKKNGFVIELMIVFMLITFGFCMVIITYLGALNSQRKSAKQTVNVQTDLNQVGEYYLRYIEESGEQFPKGTEKVTDFAGKQYQWMDDDAKTFFADRNSKNHYQYETLFSISRGGITEFFKTKFIWRKLVVKSNGKIKMIVELKETRISDTETKYYVQNWSVGDDLMDESAASGGYQQDKLSLLQKLWRFLGLSINSLQTWKPNGDWTDLITFFNTVDSNWRTAMSDGI